MQTFMGRLFNPDPLRKLIFILLFGTWNSNLVKSDQFFEGGLCKCSKISSSAQIKCELSADSMNSPKCSVDFSQAENDFDRSHTKCIGKNTFSTFGVYSGQLRNIKIFCTANYPMDINFDGMLPHQSIGINFFRGDSNSNANTGNLTTSHLAVSMNVEPDITGNYTIFGRDNRNLQTSLYVFAESDNDGPYIMFNGETVQADISKDTVVLPCRLLNPSKKISLRKKSDEQIITSASYDPKIGFIINRKDKDLRDISGEYECFFPNDPEGGNVFANVPPTVETPKDNPLPSNTEFKTDKRLSLNVTGKWIACASNKRNLKDYRLVNMRARNPSESKMKKYCLRGETECLGKREGSFNQCYSSPTYCKTVDFKEGGGIISCFFRTKSFREPHDYILGLDGKTYLDPDVNSIPLPALIQINSENQDQDGYYSGVTYKFTCTTVSYLLAQPIRWYFKLKNESWIPIEEINFEDYILKFKENYDISAKNIIYNNYKIEISTKFNKNNIIGISCGGFVWNSGDKINLTSPIVVQESTKPTFTRRKVPVQFIKGQTNHLECDFDARPQPNVEWRKDNEKILGIATSNRTLYISNVTEKDEGIYMCIARNELGQATKFFSVTTVAPSTGPGYFVTVGVPLLVLLMCSLISAMVIKHYKKTRKGLSKQEIEDFMKGVSRRDNNDEGNDYANDKIPTDPKKYELFMTAIPYPKEYEIIDGNFNIDEESLLGSGAFGMVYKGSLNGKSVAIKTLKRNAELSYLRALLTELKVMIHLKEHSNIVNLVGANTKHLDEGKVYVMVELCPMGNLEDYLKKHRSAFENQLDIGTQYANNLSKFSDLQQKPDILTSKDLVFWSYQIANGMEYLASRHVIHGDLAVRNILLQDKGVAKISDFGLSRKMYEYSNYIKQSQEPLPWRHMALESLRDLDFSTKSDIWAYGITTWEIFSLAAVPYPGLTWNASFVQEIENGLRMKRAKYSSPSIYELQVHCWMNDPEQRPSFTYVKEFFSEVLQQLGSNRNNDIH